VCDVALLGTTGTIISIGKQIRSATDNEVYEFRTDTEITPVGQNRIYVSVDEVVDSTVYAITIDSTVYDIDSGVGATANSIVAALVADINGDASAVVTAEHLPGDRILLVGKVSAFNTQVTSNLNWHKSGTVYAVNAGKIFAPQNTLTIIETPVTGWDDVNNFEAGIEGRDTELDAEARIRREESLQVVGAGTLPSIVARMQDDVEDVSQVRGFENRTDVVDGDGRPPHSIEIVVEGGLDEDIGNQLWLTKPAGIQTYSSSNDYYDVLDSNGDLQRMYFTRPIQVEMYVEATLTLYDEEEYPGDGDDQVAQKILNYGNTLDIGEDVIPQRFHGSIFEVPGIETIAIRLSDDGVIWQTTTYEIAASEIAVFDLTRITVISP